MTNLRAIAALILSHIISGRSLSNLLPEYSKLLLDKRDQGLLQAISYGVCRHYHRLSAIITPLLTKPLKKKDQDIFCLLLVGLYQLTDLRIPAHAAISETVKAAVTLKKPWAKNLINAILRHTQREPYTSEDFKNDYVALYSHPQWMIDKIKSQWPMAWRTILEANNQQPPFSLRINQQKITREEYLAKLTFSATIIPETTTGITLETPVDVSELTGFDRGELSVQDGAAQLTAGLLLLAPNQRILDAAAAPGGKTAHILESQPGAHLTAIDNDATRLEAVRDTLKRLDLTATCLAADAGDLAAWSQGERFDRILLDAPCSASGVIRRHPDIKLLRRETDIAKLSQEQRRLLNALWQVLKPGGILLYVTCSIYKEENTHVLERFLSEQRDAIEEPIDAQWGNKCAVGRQILPGMHNMDGFYFGRLRKAL